jgi:hypothetical protein
MTMDEYLAEFAVEHLLPQVWAEHEQLAQLETEVQQLYRTMEANYERSA